MKATKLFIAALMFVTSVSFENQVLVSKNGIDSTWGVSISSNSALALMEEAQAY